MNTFVVEFNNVVKNFGGIRALGAIDLRIERGETVALLGPNGAGKTTALSLMLGLRSPTSGTVRVFGQDPRSPRTRSRIGAMLQDSGLPTTLRVKEVIELFRRLYRHPMTTQAALAAARIEDKGSALISTLSGGQRQRLYFALAAVGDPDLLFLDEPTTALDVESRTVILG